MRNILKDACIKPTFLVSRSSQWHKRPFRVNVICLESVHINIHVYTCLSNNPYSHFLYEVIMIQYTQKLVANQRRMSAGEINRVN